MLIGKPSRHHVPPPTVLVDVVVGSGQVVEALAPRLGRIGLRLLPGRQNPGRILLAKPFVIESRGANFILEQWDPSLEKIYTLNVDKGASSCHKTYWIATELLGLFHVSLLRCLCIRQFNHAI